MFRPRLGVAALAGALFLLPVPRASAPTGIIAGTVTDQAGTPIASARVVVIGTALIGQTDPRGRYLIRDVTPGVHDVRAAFIGYRAVRRDSVTVRAGDTAWVNFTLAATTVELPDLTIRTQQPMVPRDEVSSKQRLSGNYVARLPVDRGLSEAAVTTGAATAQYGNTTSGAVVRGGRPVSRFPSPASG